MRTPPQPVPSAAQAGHAAARRRRPPVNPPAVAARYPAGSVHAAVVRQLAKYGAFCRLEGGAEGLLHVTELTWGRPPVHPIELLAPGQAVRVKVTEVDAGHGRLTLSLRETLPNPWAGLDARLPVGTLVVGTVKRILNFGAIVRLDDVPGAPDGAPAVEGLLHVTDLSWTTRVRNGAVGTVLREGDAVTVRVLSVDPPAGRLSLGLKQVSEDPWAADIPARHPPGTRLRGRVTVVFPFGALVEVAPGLAGMVHVSEMGGGGGGEAPPDPARLVAVGQEVEVEVLRVDPERRRIALSLRRADPPAAGEPPQSLAA